MALTFSVAAKRITVTPSVNKALGEKAQLKLLQEEIASLQRQLVCTLSLSITDTGTRSLEKSSPKARWCDLLGPTLMSWRLAMQRNLS